MTTVPSVNRRMPTQERARVTREAVLEATARLLEQSLGEDAPSTNRIAKVAGVSIGTLYQYFDGRKDIIRALARQHASEMMDTLRSHAGPMVLAGPREAVPAFVESMAEAHAVAPRLHLALLREMLADGGTLLSEVQDPAHQMVLAWLIQHRAEVRPKDLEAAAYLLTHTVEAAIHGQLLLPESRLHDPAFREELVDLLLRYLLP